jgi:hypothetical protein
MEDKEQLSERPQLELRRCPRSADPLAESRYAIVATDRGFALVDTHREVELSHHRSLRAAESTKAIHVRLDKAILSVRSRLRMPVG